LADKLIFKASVTMNMSQRIGRPLVHLPAPVTFNVSQLGSANCADGREFSALVSRESA